MLLFSTNITIRMSETEESLPSPAANVHPFIRQSQTAEQTWREIS